MWYVQSEENEETLKIDNVFSNMYFILNIYSLHQYTNKAPWEYVTKIPTPNPDPENKLGLIPAPPPLAPKFFKKLITYGIGDPREQGPLKVFNIPTKVIPISYESGHPFPTYTSLYIGPFLFDTTLESSHPCPCLREPILHP